MLTLINIHIALSLPLLCNCQRDYRTSSFISRREDKDVVIASEMKEISSCFFHCNDRKACKGVLLNKRTEKCTLEESEQELDKEVGKHTEIWERIPEISGKLWVFICQHELWHISASERISNRNILLAL